MKLKYFSESTYNELYDSIELNSSFYSQESNEWINVFIKKQEYCKESRIDASLPILDARNGDFANAVLLHQSLKDKINPKQACSPFLWSYMTHCEYWQYTSERWGKTEMSVDTIKQRFFCGPEEGNRIGFLRNSISRLWWAAYLTYQEEKSRPYELTELLFSHSDISSSIIERNFSMNKEVTIGILSAIKAINDDPKLTDVGLSKKTGDYEWRELCKYINRYGAVSLLDSLNRDDIFDLSYYFLLNNR